MKYNKLVIAGGSGYLGKLLTAYFRGAFAEVVILSRTAAEPAQNVRTVVWDACHLGEWANELDDADVLINLTGKSVDCRYTKLNRDVILSSRLDSTRVLGEALARGVNPPVVWLNASSATIYKASFHEEMDEDSGEIGNDFSMTVCKRWEDSFLKNILPTTRMVTLRTSFVLGHDAPAWKVLKQLVRRGVGGRQGNGLQYVSWIHERDFCRAVDFLIRHETLQGAFNITAPRPIPNGEFMKTLRDILGVKFCLSTPGWLLSLGAFFIRTEPELVLKSRRVVPVKLLNAGFLFLYPDVESAVTKIYDHGH